MRQHAPGKKLLTVLGSLEGYVELGHVLLHELHIPVGHPVGVGVGWG